MRDEELTRQAKSLVASIAAKPRFAGSAEERDARGFCAEELRRAGLVATEKNFEFSEWPGRFGIPLIAGGLFASIALVAAVASTSVSLGLLALAYASIAGGMIVKKRRPTATAEMRWRRSRSANLEAVRGTPSVWLVAHLDSKSQSVPMLVRVASHVLLTAVLAVEFIAVLLTEWGAIHPVGWSWFAGAGFIAALPSLLCLVGNGSFGALDNATGVAAVLLAARMVSAEKPLGVLITSGEELDLAGAREWARRPPPGVQMINCDTIDDAGGWRCMSRDRQRALIFAAQAAAKKLGLGLRIGKMIPGIITDSVAFEAAGIPSVTLSRGTLRTLARLHTSGDQPCRVSGSGTAVAARILAQMVEELS